MVSKFFFILLSSLFVLFISCSSESTSVSNDIVNIIPDNSTSTDKDAFELPDNSNTGETVDTSDTGDTATDSANTGNIDTDAMLNDSDGSDTSDTGTVNDSDVSDTGDTSTTCTPDEEQSCYTGAAGTENVGICKAGTKKCNSDGSSWGDCEDQVLPEISEICGNSEDDNCNNQVDEGCVCAPDEVESCYTGPAGTENVGECKAGTKTCDPSGYYWGDCLNSVVPVTETGSLCSDGLDNDCDGTADNGKNEDGDLWTTCAGDCCDSELVCSKPEIVNPGAVEIEGDTIDNDCNGTIDEARAGCSTGANITSSATAMNLLNAMDICQVYDSTKNTWGIVGTPVITRASGSGTVDYRQYGVKTSFGTDSSNNPIFGSNFTVLSSGRARDGNDTDATTTDSYEYETGTPPSDFISAHGNALPVTKTGCSAGSGANDSVMLKVQLKVPTNANSFSFDFRFFSQEYWTYTCTQYNDFFITMLDTAWTPGTGETAIPADKNISFDSSGNYISVNSDQFFTVCEPKSGYTCSDGTSALNDTGYYSEGCIDDWILWCNEYAPFGGATRWLTTTAPVVPGETITLRFIIWDTSDENYDSLVLLDNFRWNAEASGGAVTFACWDTNKNGVCDLDTEDASGDGECSERDCKQ